MKDERGDIHIKNVKKKVGKENGNLKREGKCTKSWKFLRKTSHIIIGWYRVLVEVH